MKHNPGHRSGLLSAAVVAMTMACATPLTSAAEIDKGDSTCDRFLLLDSRIIDSTENAVLKVGTVEKHPANPLFREDREWEARFDNLYANIFYDKEEKVFKCWYQPFIYDGQKDAPPTIEWDKVSYMERRGRREDGLCYATSRDGLMWEKPELGLVDFEGSKKNNLVLRGIHAMAIHKDPREQDPVRRYKAIGNRVMGKTLTATSPDGFHWTDFESAVESRGDTMTSLFWSRILGRYLYVTRIYDGQRKVAISESKDFKTWTEIKLVLEGTRNAQTYCMVTFEHAGVFIGLPVIFRTGPVDRCHPELAWSPDGYTWHRIDEGTPLIPLGEKKYESYDWGCIYPARDPMVMPDGTIRLYYGASNGKHTSWRQGFLALATLRPDGFAGYEQKSPDQAAVITTKAIPYAGQDIRISADVNRGGSVSMSIVDEEVKVIARAQAVSETVTDARMKLQKRVEADEIRLRFEITNAKLYSFGFAE